MTHKEVREKEDPCEMYEVTFTHIHDTSGFAVSAKYSADGKDHFPPSKHACLRHGYWCWSNAKEDPIMAVRFIWWKICTPFVNIKNKLSKS